LKIPFISKLIEKRSSSLDQKIKAFLMGENIGTESNAGKNVSEYNAMTSTAVYACVRVIATGNCRNGGQLTTSFVYQKNQWKGKSNRSSAIFPTSRFT